jgi:hypothetical protein
VLLVVFGYAAAGWGLAAACALIVCGAMIARKA